MALNPTQRHANEQWKKSQELMPCKFPPQPIRVGNRVFGCQTTVCFFFLKSSVKAILFGRMDWTHLWTGFPDHKSPCWLSPSHSWL